MVIEITDDLLKDLKDKAKKAHQGPWTIAHGFADEVCIMKSDDECSSTMQLAEMKYLGTKADAEYIAAADPSTIITLIDYIKKLEKDLGGLAHDYTEKELKIERLEKESRWLAEQVLCCSDEKSYCTYDCDRCFYANTVEDWLEQARKETTDGNTDNARASE